MAGDQHPKLTGIDLDTSYILGVIYDDDSLTLEMDFHLLADHPRYEALDSEEGCYRKGFIRFADFDDLRREEEAHRLDVAGAALHEVAGVRLVEIFRRQPLEMVVQVVAQVAGDLLRSPGRPANLEKREEARGGGEREHRQRREP